MESLELNRSWLDTFSVSLSCSPIMETDVGYKICRLLGELEETAKDPLWTLELYVVYTSERERVSASSSVGGDSILKIVSERALLFRVRLLTVSRKKVPIFLMAQLGLQ